MKELLARRKDEMWMIHVSSCIHRIGRLVNAVSQVLITPLSEVLSQHRGPK